MTMYVISSYGVVDGQDQGSALGLRTKGNWRKSLDRPLGWEPHLCQVQVEHSERESGRGGR